VVIVTQHLDHVIFTFSTRRAADASSALLFSIGELIGGGFLAPPFRYWGAGNAFTDVLCSGGGYNGVRV
jgi:hypothetical protein